MIGDEHLIIDTNHRTVWTKKVMNVTDVLTTIIALMTSMSIIVGLYKLEVVGCSLLLTTSLITYGAQTTARLYTEANLHIALSLVLIITMILFIIKIN